MTSSRPAAEAAAIVVVGSFSPGLFQPLWLATQQIIPAIEAEEAKNLVITPDFSHFETDWLLLEVVTARLVLTTRMAPYFDVLRDLADSLLAILEHNSITAIGLNRGAEYDLRNKDSWHSLGHILAPKEKAWSPILTNPGTLKLVIQGEREKFDGAINVTVEPSSRIEHGVSIELNDHYTDATPSGTTEWARSILDQDWTAHEERAAMIQKHLLSLVEQSTSEAQ